ncbi:uncharacterized protein LOC115707996 isoform X2 [Cannabis sativa]|nr:uncharacterized protein LOC115707996 isoform X2 [Cannabis sativa]XP_030491999.2 uncharacterized protein LOC115707996 isoform X2 [Cannabis sativa]
MEREKRYRNGNGNGNGFGFGNYSNDFYCDIDQNRLDQQQPETNGHHNHNHPTTTSTPSPSSSSSSSSQPPLGYIEHIVTKFDTLAGVAIKYGVEVSDIKKMNGLVTDLQMFALKSIQIPLPGRHPPSPCLSNGSNTPGPNSTDRSPPKRMHRDLFDSFQSLKYMSPQRLVSPAMSSLQGYYGLKEKNRNSSDSIEMSVYRRGVPNYLEDELFTRVSDPPLSHHHRKSRSLVSGYLDDNGEIADTSISDTKEGESERWSCDKLIRRRQKSEADFSRTPEMMLEDNNIGSSGGFSASRGKHLALRPKAAGRTMATDETGGLNPIPVGLGDSILTEGFTGVRKSSSTPSLQDPDSNGSIRPPSKWSQKSDNQGFSTASLAKPIFDGLPKPITGRRSKAALD